MNPIAKNFTGNKHDLNFNWFNFITQPSIPQDLSENKIGIEGITAITDVLLNTNNLKRLALQGKKGYLLLSEIYS